MSRSIWIIGLVLALAAGYFFFFYPPKVYERKTQKALAAFADAVASKDRAKIGAALQTFLADDAKVHLEVRMFSLAKMNDNKPAGQNFDKAAFISFIDNTLYPLSDYGYRVRLGSFALGAGHATAAVTFSSKEWADGVSYYAGSGVNMRFSSDTACAGQVGFVDGQARLDSVSCSMELRSVPKPGEEHKLENPEALRQLLR